MLKTFN